MDEPTLDALRHRHRNQIQNMTSLVGLFGRQAPAGPCRDAFADLRARLEAVCFASAEDAADCGDAARSARLAELAESTRAFLDPDHRRELSFSAEPVRMSRKAAPAIAQILVELMIELYRHGFGDSAKGAATIAVEGAPDGGARIRLEQVSPLSRADSHDLLELGRTLADSLVRSLGGRITRRPSGPVAIEVLLPLEDNRR